MDDVVGWIALGIFVVVAFRSIADKADCLIRVIVGFVGIGAFVYMMINLNETNVENAPYVLGAMLIIVVFGIILLKKG